MRRMKNVVDTSRIKGVAMAFHGPLVNTGLAYQAARIQAFKAHGYRDIPLALHAGGQDIAATSPAIVGRVLKKAGIIPESQSLLHCETTREVSATTDEIYRYMTRRGIEFQRGAVEAARHMAGHFAGRMAIVTCAERGEVLPFLERNLPGVFRDELVITRETILDARLDLKPAPDAYMLAMRLMDVREHELLGIEDSPSGLEAVIASGAAACALTSRPEGVFALPHNDFYAAASLADVKFS